MLRDYFTTLAESFGRGWNRFWFAPSDPYPLGVLRVLTGAMALYLVLTYSFDLTAMFAADGLLPPEDTTTWSQFFPDSVGHLGAVPPENYWSYLNYITTPTGLWIAHAIGVAVLTMFTLGFMSRVSAVGALLVFLAYLHRAPMLTSQVEPIVAFMLFYLCLGPCGAYLSLDRWLARRRAAREPKTFAVGDETLRSSWATVSVRLMQIHVAALYVMMALMKLTGGPSGPVWWTGEAMWWVAARPDMGLIDFGWLASYPGLIDLWTHAQVIFEFSFPLLVWSRLLRPLMLGIAAVMWFGVALLTGLVPFCLMMLVVNLVYVTPAGLRQATACCAPGARDTMDLKTPAAAA